MRSNINGESQKVVVDSFSPPTPPEEYLLLYGVKPLEYYRNVNAVQGGI